MRDWLEQFGLGKYASVFEEHDITRDVLPLLTESDIDALQLPTGARRRLIVALQSLGHGASPSAATVAVTSPSPSVAMDAERRQLTVMFCDLAGSTALAERLDPEDMRDLIQAYRRAGAQVVERYDGHVAQYLGDGLMAYFGWPNAYEDAAERGVRAALDIVQKIKEVEAGQPLAVRIGVATGTVVVGDTSDSASAEARLAVGETPHLAARLQSSAHPGEVIIAPATRRLIGDGFEVTDLGARSLKGIAAPVHAFRVDSLRRAGGRFGAAHGGEALTPFVGREDEVAQLMHLWERAHRGNGQVVLIGGEAGIGKSRLSRLLTSRVADDGGMTLQFGCSAYHVNSALHPFIDEIETMAGFARADLPETRLEKLEGVLTDRGVGAKDTVPLVANLLSLPTDRYPPVPLSAQGRKDKTLETLVQQVEVLARRQPVAVLFEDAHWIDPTSQEVLDRLIERIAAVPVLLVITHRPEYEVQWTGHPHVKRITLSRLPPSASAAMVNQVIGGLSLPAEVLERIVAQTDGVPLFVEELTKSVLESDALRESRKTSPAGAPLPALAIPTSLRDSLLARLDRLAPVKDLVQIGACIGREFSFDLVARVTMLDEAQLESRLEKLLEAGLVYATGQPPDCTYTFKHALVQDAAYDSLLKTRRQTLHARIAEVLEEEPANAPERLAYHYTQAGNLEAAVPWWCEAGKLAAQRLGVREAVAHFQRALALVHDLPASPARDDLELSIREPLNAGLTGLRGWADAEVRQNAGAILELTQRRGASHASGTGLWAVWVNTTTQGRIADSLEWAQRLLEEGQRGGDTDLQIFGHGASMISYFYLGELLEARKHGDCVLALYDPSQAERWMRVTAHDLKTLVGVWSCQWTWMLGYPDRAVQLSDEKDVHARQIGDTFNLGFALTLGAYAFAYRREPGVLFERIREITALEKEHNVPFMDQVMVPQVEGMAHLRNGQPAEAILSLGRGLENWYARGGHSRVPYLKAILAEAVALNGDVDAGLSLIEECLDQISRPGWLERSHFAEVLRLKGWMLMQRGRADEAEEPLRASIDWARHQQAKSWELRSSTTLAQLLRERGDQNGARDLLGSIYGWFTEGFDTHDLRVARDLLDSLN
jgi:class 3 adenylate cyclase/tetratricopeptide (TPR) repeat protein